MSSRTNPPCGRPLPGPKHEESANNLPSLLERLEDFAAKNQLNRSNVRAQILQVIVEEANHFTPTELLPRVQARFPGIGRATLYRTLPIFVQAGILSEGPADPNGNIRYELSHSGHHDHFVCVECGGIFEFHNEALESLQDTIAASNLFKVERHQHVMYVNCQWNEDKKSPKKRARG